MVVLGNVGTVELKQRRYADALPAYQQALVLYRELGDRDGEAGILRKIGRTQQSQGRYADALPAYPQALV